MSGALKNFEARAFRLLRREPPQGGVHRGAFWLFLAYLLFCVAGLLPGELGAFFRALRGSTLMPLLFLSAILFFRWMFGRFLWKVRNRLIVTYLLMGLAPLVLFSVLGMLVAYVLSGQFATASAASAFHNELVLLEGEDRQFALHVAYALVARPSPKIVSLPEYSRTTKANAHEGLELAAFADGRPLQLAQGQMERAAPSLPGWIKESFSGVVVDHSRLSLRVVESETIGGKTATLIASLPIEKATLDRLASGLGSVHLLSNWNAGDAAKREPDQAAKNTGASEELKTVSGGALPPPANFADIPVEFAAPLDTVDWQTGKPTSILLAVTSRPHLLYDRLFSTSFHSGTLFRTIIIGVATFFLVLELIAFFMAIRLNQTITESIHGLYLATTEIDKGNLRHRIAVKRRDQLAHLSSSFNNMSASLDRLLVEQREKQRLENELTIAQEVQENLFPTGKVSIEALELHGVCRPARTVSGDYYDFLVLGGTQLLLALGDISGKGISAALLMASLHSAVRAYMFAGEEREDAKILSGSNRYGTQLLEESGLTLFESPGKLLEMLNRHIYRSTQPEKYATLFLAHYDAANGRLTYSNGGQLPPLVLCANGTVKRLDRGGTVVGLLDDMRYDEGTLWLQPGDILVAYSDGVTEPENEFGEFGEERLMDIVRQNRHLPLSAVSDHVLQSLRAWIGQEEQPDDITLVLARQR